MSSASDYGILPTDSVEESDESQQSLFGDQGSATEWSRGWNSFMRFCLDRSTNSNTINRGSLAAAMIDRLDTLSTVTESLVRSLGRLRIYMPDERDFQEPVEKGTSIAQQRLMHLFAKLDSADSTGEEGLISIADSSGLNPADMLFLSRLGWETSASLLRQGEIEAAFTDGNRAESSDTLMQALIIATFASQLQRGVQLLAGALRSQVGTELSSSYIDLEVSEQGGGVKVKRKAEESDDRLERGVKVSKSSAGEGTSTRTKD